MPEVTPASLSAVGIRRHFGGVRAVDGVDLEVRAGEITGLIGPNGAGKTTLFNVLTKFDQPSEGSIALDGEDVTRATSWQLARRGMVRSFQTPIGFPELTVWENLLVAGMPSSPSLVDAIGGRRRWGPDVAEAAPRVDDVLEQLDLGACRDRYLSELSPGQVKLLDFGRQLLCSPRILMLDEPSSGVDPDQIARLVTFIRKIRARGVSLLIIDHNMDFLFRIADRVYVMAEGRVLCEGDPETVAESDAVMRLYLGGDNG